MIIPWTLERYIFREMGKTFVLTAAVLTGALGLGGGVMQMVELKEATPWQFVRLMALVLPVAGALTLPIAALFSAAATYGRLSADNEFTACRSGGVNLHVLLLPALVLGLVSAVLTFACMSFVIPRMVMNLSLIVGADPVTFIQQRLHRPQGLKIENHRIYADQVEADEQGGIYLTGVAFVETQGDAWIRYGTAQRIRLRFDRDDNRIGVAGTMTGLTLFDRKEDQFSQIGEQEISAPDVPFMLQHQIKFLTLGELFHYMGSPQSWPPVVEVMERLRGSLARVSVQRALLREWETSKKIVLGTDPGFVVTGEAASRMSGDDGIEITNAVIEENRQGLKRRHQAERATLESVRSRSATEGEIRIEAYGAQITEGTRVYDKDRETLGPVPVPAAMVAQISQSGIEEMLGAEQLDEVIKKRQVEARNWLEGTYRRIVATLHERAAFTFSVLVLVILGAGLGIVFRGAHAATAFGISFLPSLLVIILIVTGKQMAQNAGTFWFGLTIMWSGIAAVGVLDYWTLTRWLRR